MVKCASPGKWTRDKKSSPTRGLAWQVSATLSKSAADRNPRRKCYQWLGPAEATPSKYRHFCWRQQSSANTTIRSWVWAGEVYAFLWLAGQVMASQGKCCADRKFLRMGLSAFGALPRKSWRGWASELPTGSLRRLLGLYKPVKWLAGRPPVWVPGREAPADWPVDWPASLTGQLASQLAGQTVKLTGLRTSQIG